MSQETFNSVGRKGDGARRSRGVAIAAGPDASAGRGPRGIEEVKREGARECYPLFVSVATAFVVGCAAGGLAHGAIREATIAAATGALLCAVAAVMTLRRSRFVSVLCLALASGCAGIAWRASATGPSRVAPSAPGSALGTRSIPAIDGSNVTVDASSSLLTVTGTIDELPRPRAPPLEPRAHQRGQMDEWEMSLANVDIGIGIDVDIDVDGADDVEYCVDHSVDRTGRSSRRIVGIVRVTCAGRAPGSEFSIGSSSGSGTAMRPATTFALGDRVVVTGWLRASGLSPNPRLMRGSPRGDFDPVGPSSVVAYMRLAHESHVRLATSSPPRSRIDVAIDVARSWQRALRNHIGDAVERALPAWSSDDARRLVRMMLLGRDDGRNDAEGDLEGDFARAGLAHLVAISGFNLAILAGAIAALTRSAWIPRVARSALIGGTTVAYALIVEPQAPVARAAIIALAAALADASDRRWFGDAVLAAAAAAIVAVQPSESAGAGFQLTFLSVVALRHLAPQLHQRWYGSNREPPVHLRQAAMFGLRSLVSTSIAVWLATSAIGAWHFGRVAIWGVPLSIVAIPLGTLMLLAAYATAAIAVIAAAAPFNLNWLATVPGILTALGAETLVWIACAAGKLPLATVALPSLHSGPDLLWCALATTAATFWCRAQSRRYASLALLGLIFVWSPMALAATRRQSPPFFSVEMLSVGNGSCYLLQSGGSAVIFDAGSSSTQHVADGIVEPALDEASVSAIDAIIVSHPDLDHYSAIVRLLQERAIGRLIVTERFLEAAGETMDETGAGLGEASRIAPQSAEARTQAFGSRLSSKAQHTSPPSAQRATLANPQSIIETARSRHVPIEVARRGDIRRFGNAVFTWLHPAPGAPYRSDNDSSQVIRVSCRSDNGEGTLLLTGDLETEGIAALLGTGDQLEADLLELPHHGSWRAAAGALLGRVAPVLALQSTAPERLAHDRYAPALVGVLRRVTCRDGAIRVALEADGAWHIARWERNAWMPCGIARRYFTSRKGSTTNALRN